MSHHEMYININVLTTDVEINIQKTFFDWEFYFQVINLALSLISGALQIEISDDIKSY